VKTASTAWTALACAALLLTGCTSVPSRGGFDAVQQLSGERVGARVYWYQGGPEDAEVQQALDRMLSAELTADSAVAVALLKNRSLQATYEDLGISQADLVQAGLLRNPRIGAQLAFPVDTTKPSVIAPSFSFDFDFISLFTLPLRKRAAEESFEAAKLRVSDAVLRLSTEVRIVYFNAAAAEQLTALCKEYLDAQRVAASLSSRQRTAGNISALEEALQLDTYDSGRLQLARAEAAATEAREALTRLLGLWGHAAFFRVAPMPLIPEKEPSLDGLEARAIRQRLDLAAALHERNARAATLALVRGAGAVPFLDIGAIAERDSGEGFWSAGPSIALELPVFDQGQARVARAESALRQQERRMEQLAIDIRSQVRVGKSQVVADRNVVEFYRAVLLPQRMRITGESLLQYNAMQVGLYQLLSAKQSELNASREYVEAIRDYWTAKARLAQALGGRLDGAETLDHPAPSGAK
jgi:cobalt-zinc-cadmium efflux system outer membrane protein